MKEEDPTTLYVKQRILDRRQEAHMEYSRFWSNKTDSNFEWFQEAFLRYWSTVRVYIDASKNYEDLLEVMRQVTIKGKGNKGATEEQIEKWLSLFHRTERALYDIGVIDAIKDQGLTQKH